VKTNETDLQLALLKRNPTHVTSLH